MILWFGTLIQLEHDFRTAFFVNGACRCGSDIFFDGLQNTSFLRLAAIEFFVKETGFLVQ